MTNFDLLNQVKSLDELHEKLNEIAQSEDFNGDWDALDKAAAQVAKRLNNTVKNPPVLTLIQRSNHIIIKTDADMGDRVEFKVSIDKGSWHVPELFGAFGSDNVFTVVTSFRYVKVKGCYAGEDWGKTVTLRNQETSRRVSKSNPYWAAWMLGDFEAFADVCRSFLPGVNETDKQGNTLGHVIASHTGDDKAYNRAQWLGRLITAGLNVNIVNKAGRTMQALWDNNSDATSIETRPF